MTQSFLTDQQFALSSFLDELLTEEEGEVLTEPPAMGDGEPSGPAVGADSAPDAKMGQAPCEGADMAATRGAVEDSALIDAAAADNLITPFMEGPDGRTPILPEWGVQPFQAMVFKLGALSLALPLSELAGVLEWRPERLDPDAADGLCLGLYPHEGNEIRIVDLRQLVFADSKYLDLAHPDEGGEGSRIILAKGLDLGMVVDAVYEVLTLQPRRISWRSTRTRRQWLAGTLLEEMIVLLDVRAVARLVNCPLI